MSVKDEILKGLGFLHPQIGRPDYGVVELCAFCPGAYDRGPWTGSAQGKEGMVAGWYESAEGLASDAADVHNGWRGKGGQTEYPTATYVTLNPCIAAMTGRADNRLKAVKARTKDEHISRVRNILIDIDPERPSDVSASEAEKKAAVAVTRRVRQFLVDDCFWPEPMVADSGNGGHLVFKVHFPDEMNLAECSATVKALLGTLAEKFDAVETGENGEAISIKVDRSVFNPSRIVKLWGTVARKGDATKDRPHRASRVVHVPSQEQGPVTLPMIQAVMSLLESEKGGDEKPAPSAPSPFPVAPPSGGSGEGRLDVDAYLEHYGIEVDKVDEVMGKDGQGYKRWCLNACVFDPSHSPNEAFIGQGQDGKLFYRCFHNSCQGRTWAEARKEISGEDRIRSFMVGGDGCDFQPVVESGGSIPFPHVNKDGKPYARYENFVALIEAYGIGIKYNIMGKHEDVRLPGGLWGDSDRLRTLARDYVEDLCAKHGLPSAKLDPWMRMYGETRAYHPAKEWIESKTWDGVSRFEDLVGTVSTGTQGAWRTYLRRWLIQGIAALYEKKFCCRGVLTFTGAQGVGKTSWFKSLLPESINAFGEGLNLDPGDKDSSIITLSKWIVELGEVDATFKKTDISRLKAFLTKEKDILRVPYGRAYDHWGRRTVVGATVNDPQVLMEGTGNTRWGCFESDRINWRHGIDMQQMWAEAKVWYELGESWFLDEKETDMLNNVNQAFEVADPVKELIISRFMFDLPCETWENWMTTTEVLQTIGYDKPSRAIATNAGVILKNLVGSQEQKRVNGKFGRYYRMPLVRGSHDSTNRVTDFDWSGCDSGEIKH